MGVPRPGGRVGLYSPLARLPEPRSGAPPFG